MFNELPLIGSQVEPAVAIVLGPTAIVTFLCRERIAAETKRQWHRVKSRSQDVVTRRSWEPRPEIADLSESPGMTDLRTALAQSEKGTGNLFLGVDPISKQLVRSSDGSPAIVFGPTGSSKSSAVAIPNTLLWKESAVISSVKADLAVKSIGQRSQLGPVVVLDLGRSLPVALKDFACKWNPLEEASTFEKSSEVAKTLFTTTFHGPATSSSQEWREPAEEMLAFIMHQARIRIPGATMLDCVRLASDVLNDPSRCKELVEEVALAAEQNFEFAGAALAIADFAALPAKTAASVKFSMEAVLKIFKQFPSLTAPIKPDGSPLIDFRELFLNKGTIYIIAPQGKVNLFRPYLAAFAAAALDAATKLAQENSEERLPSEVLFLLDEITNSAAIPNFDEVCSLVRSLGIQILAIAQDFSQLKRAYGNDAAQSIVSNCVHKVMLPGSWDIELLNLISSIAGEREVKKLTQSKTETDSKEGRQTSTSKTEVTERKPLISVAALSRMPKDQMLVITRQFCFSLLMQRYFEDVTLSALASLEPRPTARAKSNKVDLRLLLPDFRASQAKGA